jgi:hypothetical protein
MSPPTTMSIARRMEKAIPGERKAALFGCARDVGYLRRRRELNQRQTSEWATALQMWGERRAKLSWSEASRTIIQGMRATDDAPSSDSKTNDAALAAGLTEKEARSTIESAPRASP